MADNVHKPDHYQCGGIETIDVIRAKLGPVGFGYYCEGNVLKYLTRWRHKGGLEDLRKARVYLDWLLVEAELTPAGTLGELMHHMADAPVSPAIEELIHRQEDAEEPGELKAGEAYREHGE